MTEPVVSNKRIAKNTIMLYIRMLLSVVVSLYTSRVVLEVLGVEDYGIYGLVGGVVSMFSFLNASMSGATSRFLTYELGKGDQNRLSDTFSTSMIIHIGIAFIVILLAETVGLWFLCNKLVIPESRMAAAHWVYQCSVISAALTITQVPYNSLIIAHERMGIYAYIEILNVLLKLAIVYILTIFHFDKLKLYAILVLIVSTLIMCIYRIYCIRNFHESHLRFVWKKDILRSMLSFTGWDLYGNMSVTFFAQGTSIILNVFLGPVVNAANNIAITVQGVLKGFAYNIIQAFRPQIIKQYAQGNSEVVNKYSVLASQCCLLMFSLMAIPLFWKAEYVLKLWLTIVPEYTTYFIRVILVSIAFNLANIVINIPIHACGRIKYFSIITGTCFLVALPIMYILLKIGFSVIISYLVIIVSHILCLICSIFILKHNVPHTSISSLVSDGYLKCVICIIPGIIILLLLDRCNCSEFISLIVGTTLNCVSIILCACFLILNKFERIRVIRWILSKFKKCR